MKKRFGKRGVEARGSRSGQGAAVLVDSRARNVTVKGWLWLHQICRYQEEISQLFPRVFFHIALNVDVRVFL